MDLDPQSGQMNTTTRQHNVLFYGVVCLSSAWRHGVSPHTIIGVGHQVRGVYPQVREAIGFVS